MTTTTISDIMRKKLETIEGTASVQQAAKKMKDRNISSLLIVDEKGKPQGIVSERDLVTTIDRALNYIRDKKQQHQQQEKETAKISSATTTATTNQVFLR